MEGKYQRVDPADLPRSTLVHSPNDHLAVGQKGTYKLLEVAFHISWSDFILMDFDRFRTLNVQELSLKGNPTTLLIGFRGPQLLYLRTRKSHMTDIMGHSFGLLSAKVVMTLWTLI